ncbi:hypothetical protein [Caulobacter mirabilis]|uniref:Uncharacterized protein n=1 Tax=Caulobacter mirabilis TaxID=69666 RepID=A0A2D2B1R8_9CAUL|nr:hypothetical protein [Caulobacter mirabilis]ATQ44204.1 hypothetical protein CSW64_18335 [Caulobacter mirabilis]
MNGLRDYHAKLLRKLYDEPLHIGLNNVDVLWPLWVGAALCAAVDIGFDLDGPLRIGLLVLLCGPGVLWAVYVLFHALRSLPARYRRLKRGGDSDKA